MVKETALAEQRAKAPAEVVERVLLQGDLSPLSQEERVKYYLQVCESVGLNPLTKPFDYIPLDGKLVLYAKRDCTDQLRKRDGVSVSITDRKFESGVYVVTAKARTASGVEDEATGVVALEKEGGEWKTAQSGKRYFAGNGVFAPLRGDALANAMMKAETKAKRRVTLSICGLGMLDETEVDTVAATSLEAGDRPAPPKPVEALPASAPKAVHVEATVDTPAKPAAEIAESPARAEARRLLDQASASGAISNADWFKYLRQTFQVDSGAKLNDLQAKLACHHLNGLLEQHALRNRAQKPAAKGDAHEPEQGELYDDGGVGVESEAYAGRR